MTPSKSNDGIRLAKLRMIYRSVERLQPVEHKHRFARIKFNDKQRTSFAIHSILIR